MTLKNNRAPLLSNIKLCSFHCHMWIQTGVTVSLTLTFCMDITLFHGNNSWKFRDTITGTWWKRCKKRTDSQTDWSVLRVAWSQLKTCHYSDTWLVQWSIMCKSWSVWMCWLNIVVFGPVYISNFTCPFWLIEVVLKQKPRISCHTAERLLFTVIGNQNVSYSMMNFFLHSDSCTTLDGSKFCTHCLFYISGVQSWSDNSLHI